MAAGRRCWRAAGSTRARAEPHPWSSPSNKLYLAYASYWLGENRNGYHPRRLHIAGLIQNPSTSLMGRTLRVG